MTGRERLLAVLEGHEPDRVPFSPNIGQWFGAHQSRGTLPQELADCSDEVDAMLKLGCDVFSRRCGPFARVRYGPEILITRDPQQEVGLNTPTEGPVTTTVETPRGVLRAVSQFQPASHTSYEREYFWKDFEREYAALKYWIEHTDYCFDAAAYAKAAARVGESGIVIVAGQQAPIKRIFNLAGPENGILWIMEHENELMELMAIHTEKAAAFAREVAESDALAMMSMDNLCSLFYTPNFFRKYCRDYYRRIGEILHANGKYWFSHACGRVAALKDQVAEVELDGLEGSPHAPLGDVDLRVFRDTIPYRRHVVWGGMTCHEQEIVKDAPARLEAHVKGLFGPMRPFHRFVFSSSCNTSVRTPFENLLLFRDNCWKHGRN
ncbi:MAG: hypothetical protein HS116_06205 [Planctomycetes bacterium]|nr:hypothetical protein [Planctomycetota bacterium]